MQPVVLRFMVAIYRQHHTRQTQMVEVQPGPTRCSKTTQNLDSVSGSRLMLTRKQYTHSSNILDLRSATRSPLNCSMRIKATRQVLLLSAIELKHCARNWLQSILPRHDVSINSPTI